MNLANILTAIRFGMVPFFAYYLYVQQYVIAAVIFVAAGLTDVLDGYVARKLGEVTKWGKLADPLADKLMQITALIMLTIHKLIPGIFLMIMLVRELCMVGGSIKLYKKEHFVVSANWYGKFATVVFYIAIMITLLFKIFNINGTIPDVIVIVSIFVTLIAMVFAFIKYVFVYKEATKKKDVEK